VATDISYLFSTRSARTLLTSNLPTDPNYDASLDLTAGTLIPPSFLPYTHAILPYPFDPSNIFNKSIFFLFKYVGGDRPAVIASQRVVVREMGKLGEEEDLIKQLRDLPEFEVKLENDIDIKDRRVWREKLGWIGADDVALREKI
jgi:hypothetical protein